MELKNKFLAGLFVLFMAQTTITFSQDVTGETDQPPIIAVTTAHINFDNKEGNFQEWQKMEEEYFNKVTAKNDDLMSTGVLMHYYTEDNSEIKFIRVCKNWEAIEKAGESDNELIKEAWPDKEERIAFFSKLGKYYTTQHSDEIYQATEGVKFLDEEETGKEHVYYVRVSHLAFPEDSEPGEIQALHKEYVENVTHKNPLILAYYPYRHLYGADSREFVEVFVVNSLSDLEKSSENIGDLVEAQWPDTEKRKEFFQKYNKYFTGWHADYIYRNVPELSK